MADFTRLFDLIDYQAKTNPLEKCISSKKADGTWKSYSTQDLKDNVDELSKGLHQYGLKKDDKIAIIANNRPEWNFVDLAALQLGCVDVPIYPTITEADYKFIFNDAQIKVAFVSDKYLYNKLQNIKADCPSLQEIYTFDKVAGAKHWTELQIKDNSVDIADIRAISDTVKSSELATIIYTSGTTGTPKGVMLSHNNIGSNVSAASDALPIELGNRTLSFLPLCHIFERTVFYSYLYKCVSLYYAESIETIGDDIRDVKPHYFTSVPRLLEKVYDKIVAKGNDLEGFKKKLFFWALELGDQYDLRGKGPVYKVKLAIARKLIFSKWKDALGGEILGIITGAAALQSRLERVFNAAGIRVRQGYGMTESSPVITINRFDDNDAYLATVGKPVKGVQVKIDEVTGEICAKGPNVMMGYLNRPDATAETIDADGWLRTGDKGEWVDGKYLRITDRIKSLFKTSGGKYVAPQVIENKYKESPLIEQIMVVGNDRKFVGALIVPSLNLLDHCKENGIEANTLAEAVKNDKVIAHYESICSHFNENFSKIEKIKRFRLMPNDWTIDGGEMTPTMKLKRKKIEAKYMDYIEDIYNV